MFSAGHKRQRENGQVSREEYEAAEDDENSQQLRRGFPRATPAALAQRRLAHVRADYTVLFENHITRLNRAFVRWIGQQIRDEPDAFTIDGADEYLAHVAALKDRYMRREGQVLTWGDNDCLQLGLPGETNARRPRVVRGLRDIFVKAIACGALHNVVVTETGDIWTFGCSDDGVLGRLDPRTQEEKDGDEDTFVLPAPVAFPTARADVKFTQVAAGDTSCVVVTSTGELYAWGTYKDENGKFWFFPEQGAGPEACYGRVQPQPTRVRGAKDVADIRCGGNFTLALLEDSSVVSFGLGERGVLGRRIGPLRVGGDNDDGGSYDFEEVAYNHLRPKPILEPLPLGGGGSSSSKPAKGVCAIGAGSYHGFVVMGALRDVYAFGMNNYGQLGLGENKVGESFSELTRVSALDGKGVVTAAGGQHHSVFITGEGKLMACGRSDSSQLGAGLEQSSTRSACTLPVNVCFESENGCDATFASVAVGEYHNLALTKDKELYSWGFGELGALGDGQTEDRNAAVKVDLSEVRMEGGRGKGKATPLLVSAGTQHSAMVAEVEVLQ